MNGDLERPSPRTVLASSTLLGSLAPEQIDALLEHSRLAQAGRGEVIWMDGSEASYFGIVGTGFVKMVRSSAGGQELTAEIMGPGQSFGLLGAIEGTGCPLSARAVSAVWYLRVPKTDFLALYGGNLPLRDHLIRRTTLRLRGAIDMMSRMASGRVEHRIAAVLIQLAESYGVAEEDGAMRLEVPLSRQDLAELAGTTVETTIRITSRWTKEGVLKASYRSLTIQNLARLLEILGD